MRDMHERCFRGAEDSPHFDRALSKPDQFAQFFAARLDRLARLKALPAATRQDGALEVDRCHAEPSAASQNSQSFFVIHLKEAFSDVIILTPHAANYPNLCNVKTSRVLAF
ncbi:hypothetical protein [Rhodoblastus sp.]|uniref:hypothetical protein n=1 Tax=Rhodoblastus sp. TaxID=1962975 RepID=UPI003F993F49